MKKFRIPLTWLMSGFYEVEAESEDEAVLKVDALPNALPNNGSFMETTEEIDLDEIEEITE